MSCLKKAILRVWHFGDNPEFTDDRLSKIFLMVNAFNKKCFYGKGDLCLNSKSRAKDTFMNLQQTMAIC